MRASIIIAAHNEGAALWQTVRSCVETCAGLDYELVIADDASVDDSVAEVQRRFPQVRVVRHMERCGAAPTKALGAREARGDVFVFLDGHCNPEHGAIARLVNDIADVKGNAIVTPAIAGLDVHRWRNSPSQIGHGYFLDLEKFDCGWLPLSELRGVDIGRRRFYESPALIGCALALSRELYEDLWGFDRRSVSGVLPVVVNAAGPLGAGWSLGGIPSLLLGSAGIAIVDNSSGGSRYFSGTGPSYTSPANDRGTLVQNGDGSYTYTAKDQVKTNCDSTGRMTSQVDTHGLTQALAYSGALLSTITQPDGGVATFHYNNNLLSSIQLPGSRTLTPTYDGNNNLTGFTDAAGGAYTFGYDSSHRLVGEQVGPLNTTYAYSSSNGTLTQINRGLGTTLAVTAAAVQGLGKSTAINAKQAVAALTDGLNRTTNYLLDPLGRPLQLQTADGYTIVATQRRRQSDLSCGPIGTHDDVCVQCHARFDAGGEPRRYGDELPV